MTSQRSRHKRSGDEVSAIILENAGREAGLRGNMAAMWREGRYTDLEVVVEGRSLHVHRVVVCAESEYMKTMCESGVGVEGRSRRVELAELAADAVEHAVAFMYEGRCTLPSADMLESLGEQSALEARLRGQTEAAQIPTWQRSHPLTTDRVRRATATAQKTGLQPGARARNADQYFAAVDGMLYGDNPNQGYAEDSTFSHPSLRIRFQAPQGFYLNNASDAVTMEGPNGLRAQFSGGRISGSLDNYVTSVAQALVGQQQGVQAGQIQRTNINNMAVSILPLRAQTSSGNVDVQIVGYQWDANTAYHFVTIAPAGRSGNFDTLIRSFRRLTDREAAALRPRVIDVVTVGAGDTLQSMARRMAFSNYQLERFLVINDREANQPLRPGEKVKIVVYGRA